MSKRKTRQQKIIADLHRKLQSQSSLSSSADTTVGVTQPKTMNPTYSYKMSLPTQKPITTVSMAVDNRYIQHDLIKTTLVTTIIVALQLVLFFILKNHMITIPMVRY